MPENAGATAPTLGPIFDTSTAATDCAEIHEPQMTQITPIKRPFTNFVTLLRYPSWTKISAVMSVGPPTRILVAEDDPDIGSLLEHYLRKAGFLPTLVSSGRDVMPQIKREAPDL